MTEHDGCEGCKFFAEYSKFPSVTEDMPCYECENAHVGKTLKDKYEPMTKADEIRNSSNEELVEWIWEHDTKAAKYGRWTKEQIMEHLKKESKHESKG